MGSCMSPRSMAIFFSSMWPIRGWWVAALDASLALATKSAFKSPEWIFSSSRWTFGRCELPENFAESLKNKVVTRPQMIFNHNVPNCVN